MIQRKKKGKKSEKNFQWIKKSIKNGKRSFLSNERLSLYEQILSQNFKYYFLDQDNDQKYNDSENLKINLAQTTQLHILNPEWIWKNICTMENSLEKYLF